MFKCSSIGESRGNIQQWVLYYIYMYYLSTSLIASTKGYVVVAVSVPINVQGPSRADRLHYQDIFHVNILFTYVHVVSSILSVRQLVSLSDPYWNTLRDLDWSTSCSHVRTIPWFVPLSGMAKIDRRAHPLQICIICSMFSAPCNTTLEYEICSPCTD